MVVGHVALTLTVLDDNVVVHTRITCPVLSWIIKEPGMMSNMYKTTLDLLS